MIVNLLPGDRLEIITQIDHARFAAELLGLWTSDGLPGHSRRRDLLFAVREHDNGWREKDSAPLLDLDMRDRPYDFITMPAELRVEIWRLGCQRFLEEHRYASLLIIEHARHLHSGASGASYRQLTAWLQDQSAILLEDADFNEHALETDYGFLELADLISLAACSNLFDTQEARGVNISRGGADLRLEPFPLAGTTTFRIPRRIIPRRTYLNAIELAGELATARWAWREIRLIS